MIRPAHRKDSIIQEKDSPFTKIIRPFAALIHHSIHLAELK